VSQNEDIYVNEQPRTLPEWGSHSLIFFRFTDQAVKIDYLDSSQYRVLMEDEFIQCPACKGEGIDLDGFLCWKCRGDGQITHTSTSKDPTDTNATRSTC
jgi:hypothetical protein